MTTPHDFALALLSGLGLPMTQNNIDALVSAQAAEGGFMSTTAEQTAYYNPLNITQILNSTTASGYQGGTVPIQAYPDWATGLAAAVKIFQNGFYNDILASLRASATPQATLAVWAKNPNYGWTTTPAVNTAYGSQTFPQGPSSVPLVVPPQSGAAPMLVNPVRLAGTTLMVYVFWQLFKLLGK